MITKTQLLRRREMLERALDMSLEDRYLWAQNVVLTNMPGTDLHHDFSWLFVFSSGIEDSTSRHAIEEAIKNIDFRLKQMP